MARSKAGAVTWRSTEAKKWRALGPWFHRRLRTLVTRSGVRVRAWVSRDRVRVLGVELSTRSVIRVSVSCGGAAAAAAAAAAAWRRGG